MRITASYLAKRIIEFATPESTSSLESPFNAVLSIVNEFTSKESVAGSTTRDNATEELVIVLGLLKISLVLPPSILSPTQIYIQRRLESLSPLIDLKSMDEEATATLSTLLKELMPSLSTHAASSTLPFYHKTRDILQALSNQFQSPPAKEAVPQINLDEETFGPTPDLTIASFLINDIVSGLHALLLDMAEPCDFLDETNYFELWIRFDDRRRSSLLRSQAADRRCCVERYTGRTSRRSVLPRDIIGVDDRTEEWRGGFAGD